MYFVTAFTAVRFVYSFSYISHACSFRWKFVLLSRSSSTSVYIDSVICFFTAICMIKACRSSLRSYSLPCDVDSLNCATVVILLLTFFIVEYIFIALNYDYFLESVQFCIIYSKVFTVYIFCLTILESIL